jgi:hypothetical protein
MKSSHFALQSAALVSAFSGGITLPSDLNDGVYVISIDQAGKHTVQDVTHSILTMGTLSLDDPQIEALNPGRLRKRYSWYVQNHFFHIHSRQNKTLVAM